MHYTRRIGMLWGYYRWILTFFWLYRISETAYFNIMRKEIDNEKERDFMDSIVFFFIVGYRDSSAYRLYRQASVKQYDYISMISR